MSVTEPKSPVLKTPEWLEVLENKRKRPHKLAHDIGAGAPCLVCKDECKGLNLHFWRKLCIECKCRKEDHEIQEQEDYAQFEILFGAKKVKRTMLKFNTQSKSFDWIPPNVAPDLVLDYLKSIPESKIPVSNSEGARYRKQQLEKQVPLHDVDPNACFNLSDKEIKEFQKYLDNLKNNVIGQGKILKYQSPKMLMENYVQRTSPNMIATSEEYVGIKPQAAEIKGQLTIDKMSEYNALSQTVYTESYPANVKFCQNSLPVSTVTNDSHFYKTHSLRKNERENFNSQNPFFTSPKPFNSFSHKQRGETPDVNSESTNSNFQNNLSLRTPSSFINKKNSIHDKQNNNMQPDNNKNVGSASMEDLSASLNLIYSKNNQEESKLIQGCSSIHQDLYNASICKNSLSQSNVSSSEVPFFPVQECGKIYVPNTNDKTHGLSKDGFNIHSEEVLNTLPVSPAKCQQCLEILHSEEVVVQTERGGNSALWHARCFVCETCQELLVDLMYFYHKGKVYCGRHYAEIMSIPRCYGCDELIFVKEYTVAEGQSYHVHHFCCFHCDEPLGGKQYIPKDSFPVCLDCYQVKYGKSCQTCRLLIAAGEQRVSWKDLDFHVSSECFRCSLCKKSLLGGSRGQGDHKGLSTGTSSAIDIRLSGISGGIRLVPSPTSATPAVAGHGAASSPDTPSRNALEVTDTKPLHVAKPSEHGFLDPEK